MPITYAIALPAHHARGSTLRPRDTMLRGSVIMIHPPTMLRARDTMIGPRTMLRAGDTATTTTTKGQSTHPQPSGCPDSSACPTPSESPPAFGKGGHGVLAGRSIAVRPGLRGVRFAPKADK